VTSTANFIWVKLLRELLDHGTETAPRDLPTRELLGHQTRIHMRYPVTTITERELGYRFMAAEAAWILSGDNRVATILPYAKNIINFSDDRVWFSGAYGPPFVEQVGYVVQTLRDDPASRQAVMTIWRPRPGRTRDCPCTVALQWLIRGNWLNCLATMRSSDAWLGWPYDTFNFSAMSAYVALLLRDRGVRVALGDLVLTAGSQHLYEPQWVGARYIVNNPGSSRVKPLDLADLATPIDLIEHLWAVARRDPTDLRCAWLTELIKDA
jgi:thymidylate synthase